MMHTEDKFRAEIDALRAENEKLKEMMQLPREGEAAYYYQRIMRSSPSMVLILDASGRVADCTQSFVKNVGFAGPSSIRGAKAKKVFARFATHQQVDQIEDALAHTVSTRQSAVLPLMLDISLSGQPRRYLMHLTPMYDELGQEAGSMLLFEDTTDLTMAKEAAEKAFAEKNNLFSMVSHEIRTTINSILGISGMIRDNRPDLMVQTYMQEIDSAADGLMDMVRDVGTLAELDADTIQIEPEYFSLHELLRSLEEAYDAKLAVRRIGFLVDIAPDVPEVVYGDRERIQQILDIQLRNAIQYTVEGTIRFTFSQLPDGTLQSAVRDSTSGISKEALMHLFDPSAQNEKTLREMKLGTPIGFVVASRLCQLMDGSMTAQKNASDEGITTYATFHTMAGDMAKIPSGIGCYASFLAPEARVLVVDDVELNQQVTAACLEAFGIRCDVASSGLEALHLVRRKSYDIIFMDHIMPGMDGIEVTQAIRTMPETNNAVPIIALTANAISGAKGKFLASGFHDYLAKPLDRSRMAECLRQWLPARLIHNESR